MIEIRKNVIGDIIVKETEERKGLGTFWNMKILQQYIAKNRVDKHTLHHLCLFAVEQMGYVTMIELKESEKYRLCSDLERMIKDYYYNDEERDFTVELVNEQLEFKEDGSLIQKITMGRFLEDLKVEPDPFDNAIQLINFALGERKLNEKEQNKLANTIVEFYKNIQKEKIEKAK